MVRPAVAMRSRKPTSVAAMNESNPEVGSSQNKMDGLALQLTTGDAFTGGQRSTDQVVGTFLQTELLHDLIHSLDLFHVTGGGVHSNQCLKGLPEEPIIAREEPEGTSPDTATRLNKGASLFAQRTTNPNQYCTEKFFPGLVNLGNTCYINAVLQSLYNTSQLVEFFLSKNNSSLISKCDKELITSAVNAEVDGQAASGQGSRNPAGENSFITESLEMFLQEEELSKDNQVECSKCKKKQNAKKRLSIWALPKVLKSSGKYALYAVVNHIREMQ
ncbi:Ubiquitin carboxyl-terminal hydrolase 8 [Tyrophagus putrescentiae]|nr:Ubiquitin carboxyl-terminal hydrolase 8 [Tyrophagus putrescentiae]